MYEDDQLAWQGANEDAAQSEFYAWCDANDIDFEDCGHVEQFEIREDYFNWLTNEKEDLSIYTMRL